MSTETLQWLDTITPPRTYEPRDFFEGKTFVPTLLAEAIMRQEEFVTFKDSKEIYVYDPEAGIYRPDGETVVEELAQRLLQSRTRPCHVTEALKIIKYLTYIDRGAFYCPENYLVVQNGVLDILTGEILPCSSDIYALSALNVVFDPTAECPAIMKFLSEVVSPQDILVLQELVGYLLESGYPFHKAFMLLGGGRNGKTVFMDLLLEFLGIRNVSSVALQELGGRFAKYDLFGKLANICDDLSDKDLNHTGTFKELTGGSLIRAEKKFHDSFTYVNKAKLVFAANRLPKSGDDSYAYFSRWIIVVFPNQFVEGENADPHLRDRLTTPEELSGFLNWALEGLRRLRKNGRFSHSKTVEEMQEYYQRLSDSVAAFLSDKTEVHATSEVHKKTLYGEYQKHCKSLDLVAVPYSSFCKRMKSKNFKETRKSMRGGRVLCFRGLKMKTSLP